MSVKKYIDKNEKKCIICKENVLMRADRPNMLS